MVDTLLVGGLLGLCATALFVYVAIMLGQRPVLKSDRAAHTAFRLWWVCLALYTASGGAGALMAAGDFERVGIFLFLSLLGFFSLCIGFASLAYYLLYIYTGGHRAALLVFVFYAAICVVLAVLATGASPTGIEERRWAAGLSSTGGGNALSMWVFTVLLIFPIIGGAVAYLLVGFKVPDRTTKYRIRMVAWSLIVWFTLPLLFLAAGQFLTDTWDITALILALLAGLAIIVAYKPPAWARRRWSIRSLSEEMPAT